MSPSATTTTAAPATNGNGAIKAKNGVNGSANGTHANGNGVVKNGNGIAKNGKEAHLSSAELIRLENEHGAHNYHPLPVVFDRALGAKVWDPEGREYIDMLSAYSAVNQGHCHPRIVAALVAQAQKLTLSSRAFHNSVFGRFAERVGGVFGWEMVLPMNTGAEAVEERAQAREEVGVFACVFLCSLPLFPRSGIRILDLTRFPCKGVPEGEAIVLSVADNFHGRTLGIISMSTDPSARVGFGPYLPGVGPTFVDPEAEGGSRLIRFRMPIIVPPPTYLPAVAALCKKHNVLLICDEIQTGLGRTGKGVGVSLLVPSFSRLPLFLMDHPMLAIDHAGIRPDIVLLGKALSGGVYPVSAVLADKDVMLGIQHGSTYGGNPLACAVAITALDVLVEEDLSARAARLGEVFRSSVLALKSPYIKTVRGLGLLNAVVIDEDAYNAARATRGQDVAGNKRRTAWQFCLLLKARGVLAKTTHGNVVRFAPPLVIEEADLVKAARSSGSAS
ncbi:ornithine aminotransferase [Mycena olivaceomarginata]|nr:ornithine aminotransferase [Mycena olivaceomarginata]